MKSEKEILTHAKQFIEENQKTLERELEINKEKAKKILKNKQKLDMLLSKIEKICRTLAKFPIPYFSEIIADIPKMIWLVRDYKNAAYREVPYASIIAIIGGFIYMATPIDFIPDAVPVVGVLDDLVVFQIILNVISSDLNDYWEWHLYNYTEEEQSIEN